MLQIRSRRANCMLPPPDVAFVVACHSVSECLSGRVSVVHCVQSTVCTRRDGLSWLSVRCCSAAATNSLWHFSNIFYGVFGLQRRVMCVCMQHQTCVQQQSCRNTNSKVQAIRKANQAAVLLMMKRHKRLLPHSYCCCRQMLKGIFMQINIYNKLRH